LFFAYVFSLNAGTFAAIGLTSVLAGAANTPIAASIMAVELFGPQIAPYATVACVISFLITGHRSVYPSQILSISKSPSLQVELGKELGKYSIIISSTKEKLNRVLSCISLIQVERLVRKSQAGTSSSDHSKDDDAHNNTNG
jgi:hypothetical protein